jgi:hypothetical protein
MTMTATVKELREWLADKPDSAHVAMAGVSGVNLVGWRAGRLMDETPIVLLAFDREWPSSCVECPECGAEVDTREARPL